MFSPKNKVLWEIVLKVDVAIKSEKEWLDSLVNAFCIKDTPIICHWVPNTESI